MIKTAVLKKIKKLSLFIILTLILSGFNGIPLKAEEKVDNGIQAAPVILQDPTEIYGQGGYIPSPIKIEKATYPFMGNLYKSTVLPDKYDLRQQGYVTPVRNQGSIGACWTFSTYGSLESTVKKFSGEDYDFSEIHMALHNGVTTADAGGNNYIATAYLVSGKGPILEEQDPYPNPSKVEYIITREGLEAKYRVQDIIFLPARTNSLDNDELKNAIITYGAVSSSYYDSANYYTYKGQTTYYNGYTRNLNHAITLVGWDDNFSRNNFDIKPPGDGAFLAKNSWGSSWGDNGYYYISYYDVSLGYDSNVVYNGIEKADKYDTMHSYYDKPLYSYYKASDYDFVGNRFKAEKQEYISAVGFYTFAQNLSYEIWIDKIVDSQVSAPKTKITSGTLPQGGYHTIELPSSFNVAAGEEYMIWVKLSAHGYYGHPDKNLAANKSYLVSGGKVYDSQILLGINIYANEVDYNNYLMINSEMPADGELSPEDNITISFNDYISKGMSYSKISLKDEKGIELEKSIEIQGKDLIIKELPENHINGKLILYIPQDAVKNTKGQNMYKDYKREFSVYVKASTIVEFKDASLEQVIRRKLKKDTGYITAGDMRTITHLDASYCEITNLRGLEYAVRLQYLNLNDNKIISLKPLSNCYELITLNIRNNNIKDLSPLTNLTNLSYINLMGNAIRDIAPLENLITLKTLNISNNLIGDIYPLKGLNNLISLDISANYIKDIYPLKLIAENNSNSNLEFIFSENSIDFSVASTASLILDAF
ncbi:MAG: hypothetical protein GX306_06880 [Clostridiales bacterium]|nr:hypothetical protein [Clostridiales bacterium]